MSTDRREFLKLLSTAAAAAAFPAPISRALALPANNRTGTINDVEHIVFVMKENRSFDHYFGTLRGVRGFDDPAATRPDGSSVFRQPDPLSPDGHVLPFRLDTLKTNAQRYHALDHGSGALHASWNGVSMDKWI